MRSFSMLAERDAACGAASDAYSDVRSPSGHWRIVIATTHSRSLPRATTRLGGKSSACYPAPCSLSSRHRGTQRLPRKEPLFEGVAPERVASSPGICTRAKRRSAFGLSHLLNAGGGDDGHAIQRRQRGALPRVGNNVSPRHRKAAGPPSGRRRLMCSSRAFISRASEASPRPGSVRDHRGRGARARHGDSRCYRRAYRTARIRSFLPPPAVGASTPRAPTRWRLLSETRYTPFLGAGADEAWSRRRCERALLCTTLHTPCLLGSAARTGGTATRFCRRRRTMRYTWTPLLLWCPGVQVRTIAEVDVIDTGPLAISLSWVLVATR